MKSTSLYQNKTRPKKIWQQPERISVLDEWDWILCTKKIIVTRKIKSYLKPRWLLKTTHFNQNIHFSRFFLTQSFWKIITVIRRKVVTNLHEICDGETIFEIFLDILNPEVEPLRVFFCVEVKSELKVILKFRSVIEDRKKSNHLKIKIKKRQEWL